MKAYALWLGLGLLSRTWRFTVRGVPPGKGVLVFWHGHMLPVWAFFARRRAVALVSTSRDGQLLAFLLRRWGFECVRGSSTRGGRDALEQLIAHAKDGALVMITPDGPRGPRGVVKRGAIVCALEAGTELLWCTVRCYWAWGSKRSWDRFLLPLPFARIELEFSVALPLEGRNISQSEINHYCTLLAQQYALSD